MADIDGCYEYHKYLISDGIVPPLKRKPRQIDVLNALRLFSMMTCEICLKQDLSPFSSLPPPLQIVAPDLGFLRGASAAGTGPSRRSHQPQSPPAGCSHQTPGRVRGEPAPSHGQAVPRTDGASLARQWLQDQGGRSGRVCGGHKF